MKIVLIAALTRELVIGREGTIPWHYPADMRHFRRITLGHPVVVGRRTFESFPRRPLPGRTNIVLTRNPAYQVPEGVISCRNLEEAVAWCSERGAGKLFVLGGAEVYREVLPVADEMVLTWIPEEIKGDTFFPEWNQEEWEVVDSREEDGLRFVTYRRIRRGRERIRDVRETGNGASGSDPGADRRLSGGP